MLQAAYTLASSDAIPLLNHETLEDTTLHSTSSRLPPPDAGYYLHLPPFEDIGKYGHTELVHLKLVDCYIRLTHLERILNSRALQTLSICSDSDLRKVLGVSQVNFEPLLKAISGSRSGQSIEKL